MNRHSKHHDTPQSLELDRKTDQATPPSSIQKKGGVQAKEEQQRTVSLHSGRNIVPNEGIAGQALLTVITIMAFLACLTLGGVTMISDAARDWQSDISREMTVQIRPIEGIDMDQAIRTSSKILLEDPAISNVTALNENDSKALLEPWLGSGLELSELPIPALLIVKTIDGQRPDLVSLKAILAEAVPNASLDDHKSWVARLSNMAFATVIVGMFIFLLVMTATILTVVFATRGAMAGNKEIVEVLHFVGADRKFIAKEFEQHFLILGLKGSVIGGLVALFGFLGLSYFTSANIATPQGDQIAALFGSFSLSWIGYLGIFLVIVAVALLTAITSRITVMRHVGHLETYGNQSKI